MAVITGYYANLTRSVKTDTMARGTRGPICGIDHQYATLMTPISAKQLSVALPSFAG